MSVGRSQVVAAECFDEFEVVAVERVGGLGRGSGGWDGALFWRGGGGGGCGGCGCGAGGEEGD